MVMPDEWSEPAGAVAFLEAMACGTPVLAFRCGSVSEIIEDGFTGRIVSSVDEAVGALAQVPALDRKAIRRRFEERFSSTRITNDYLRLYRSMIRKAPRRGVDVPALAAAAVVEAGHPVPAHSNDLIEDAVSLGHGICPQCLEEIQ